MTDDEVPPEWCVTCHVTRANRSGWCDTCEPIGPDDPEEYDHCGDAL